jgi:hypothetical protein
MLGTGKTFIFKNHPLQEHLGPIPNIVLNTVYVFEKYLMYCGGIAPDFYSIFYHGIKMSKIYNL